jgi:hypothetical protein
MLEHFFHSAHQRTRAAEKRQGKKIEKEYMIANSGTSRYAGVFSRPNYSSHVQENVDPASLSDHVM